MRLATSEHSERLLAGDTGLMERAQKGDRQAFALLVEKYWDRLYRWLYRLTGNQHAAEDLAQETFLKALRGLRLFRQGGNFSAWLFRIAYNAFLNQQRRASARREPFPETIAAHDAEPPDQVISRETLRLLKRAIRRLPAEYRAPLLLRAEEGLSFREIAGILNTTEETARWRVFKARQKLLSELAPQLDREKQ